MLASVMTLSLATSCHRAEVKPVPVQGTITYGGGKWPIAGMLYFTPFEPAPEAPLRPGWATFDTEGRFRVTTLQEGDGLFPGKYRVAVEAFTAPWEMGQPKPSSCTSEPFQSPPTSGLAVAVTAGDRRVVLQWDVPKP